MLYRFECFPLDVRVPSQFIASVYYLLRSIRSSDTFVQTSESDNRWFRINSIAIHSNQYPIETIRRTRFHPLSCPHTPICTVLLLNYTTSSSDYLLFIIIVVIIICALKLSLAYPLRSERTRNKRFSRVQFYNAITRNDVYINIQFQWLL